MTPATLNHIIAAAMTVLPPQMNSPEARRMLRAIAYQESNLRHRVQVNGPARGYWQFEMGGLNGVIRHTASSGPFAQACEALDYVNVNPSELHAALIDNDVLACVAARLLLYTLPWPLPKDEQEGWRQYQEAWRPGKPHPDRWPQNWARAEWE